MVNSWIEDWQSWWATVSPEFAFLLALPFAIAAAALIADAWRATRAQSSDASVQRKH
jgi:hypothetical protein